MQSCINTIIVPTIQCEIPYTSKETYITGIHALNIHGPNETGGDWHDVFYHREGIDKSMKVTLGGDYSEIDTNSVFKDYGIYEGRESLCCMGLYISPSIKEVYIANHFRAILDLLYRSLKRYESVYNLTDVTNDWLDTPEQKALLLSKAELLYNVFSEKAREALHKWIARERGGACP